MVKPEVIPVIQNTQNAEISFAFCNFPILDVRDQFYFTEWTSEVD